jgi:acetate kinase
MPLAAQASLNGFGRYRTAPCRTAIGTRTGTLDSGVILYLLQHEGMNAQAIQQLIYERSGRTSLPASKVSARIVPTDENLMVARHTRHLLDPGMTAR